MTKSSHEDGKMQTLILLHFVMCTWTISQILILEYNLIKTEIYVTSICKFANIH